MGREEHTQIKRAPAVNQTTQACLKGLKTVVSNRTRVRECC